MLWFFRQFLKSRDFTKRPLSIFLFSISPSRSQRNRRKSVTFRDASTHLTYVAFRDSPRNTFPIYALVIGGTLNKKGGLKMEILFILFEILTATTKPIGWKGREG